MCPHVVVQQMFIMSQRLTTQITRIVCKKDTLVCTAVPQISSEFAGRVTIKMVLSVTVAVVVARTLLQGAARMLAKHATDELYQLTVIAFCLVGAWISGYLVRKQMQ